MEKINYVNILSRENSSAKSDLVYRQIILRLLSRMNKGFLTLTLPEGEIIQVGDNISEIRATIQIKNNAFFRKCFLYADIGFGESYVDGDWETDSIKNVISWMILNIENNPAISGGNSKFAPINLLKSLNKLFHKINANTKSGSKKNISAHYDLSNDFYKLWLDETMTYSSAVFEDKDISLKEAQIEKYDRICRELKIKPTDHILEIGTGWGGFSIYAAENYGCKITTTTISKNQFDLANKRITEKGLNNKIETLLLDYRELMGQYDKIISIEMLEAVGHEYLETFFAKINSLLKKDGAAALQVITSHDSNYDSLRKGVDWIQKHIFPGSLLPSIAALNKAVNKTSNLYLHNLKNFGLDYAKTLKLWREKFNGKHTETINMGFDEYFIRKWNYYLSYCEAAFEMRNISVVQMIYTRPNNRNL